MYASSPQEVSLLQRLSALYRLNKEVTVSAGSGLEEETETLGYRGWDCSRCSEVEREERGCWIEGRQYVANSPMLIDYTGDEERDLIRVCPRSLEEPGLQGIFNRLGIIESSNGLGAHFGVVPADLPTRLSWIYAAVIAIKDRWKSQVQDAQYRCQQTVAENRRRNV